VRVFVLDTYYPAFLDAHYKARPELAQLPYDEQLTSLMEQSFGTSDAYSRFLRALGHEAVESVANCEPLQLAWAREHGVWTAAARRLAAAAPRRLLLRRIALAQIDEFDPDVVYAQDLWFLTARDVDALRRRGRFVTGQIASAPPPERLLRRFHLLTTSFPHFVERFRRLGVDAEYLRIAFDERVLEQLRRRRPGDRAYDVTFVGGLDPAVHPARTRLLGRVAAEADLAVWGYGAEALPEDSPVRRCYRGAAWGLDMYEILARSRVTLNRHIDLADGYANNMRLFEATGVGALLLTEARTNLTDLFEPGREVAAYQDEDDLVSKLRHYLEREEERAAVAAAGQARTLREHTYARRMAELAAMLEERLE
jgi:hypothetical protein